MKLSSFALGFGQRSLVSLSAAAVLGVSTAAFAQAAPAPAAQAPAAAAAPDAQADPFKFSTDAGGVIWYVHAANVADFESVWSAIRAKLAASDNPDYKALGDSLKIYKLASGATTDDVMYLFIADPASKTLSYGPSPFLLFTSKLFTDTEGRDMFTKLNTAVSKISPMSLDKVK